MDFLKSAVSAAIAKSASFPYAFNDRVDDDNSIWTLHNGTKREDGSSCSVFTFDINANKSRLPLAKNAARKLRTLRYPGIVKVIEVIENEANIYIVTERITPLTWHIKRKSLNEETQKWGLYTVTSTLRFINNDASSVHGSIRASSVYTSESGEWKLGGFELLSSVNDDEAIIYNYGTLVPDSNRYAPPEVAANGWSSIKKYPHAAADAYGLGILIYEAFNGPLSENDQLGQTKNIPAAMVHSYRRLINANAKLRMSAGTFLEQGKKAGGFFETPLIHITEGAESLGLKNEVERDEFLSELDGLTDDFPEDFFKMKILPELQKSVEFGGGGPKVFNAIMKIGAKLSDDEFDTRLTPLIIRLFASPDRAIRVCLLDNLPLLIDRISQKDINGKIFPMLVTGFTDTAPLVREQTVKSTLVVIGKLSDRTINGELLRYLAKTANDEQPGIRTNTTICLGKIAKFLGGGSRAKVLIAAFTRSLRDPFVHARSAALMALSATIEYFTEDDCATKIMPCICACLLDKEKLVREQASRTMDTYLQRVRKCASTMAETALSSAENGSVISAPATRMGNQSDTTWTGWAVSSFTNKLGSARGEMAAVPTNGGLPQTRSTPISGRATPTVLGQSATERPSLVSAAEASAVQPAHINKGSTSLPEMEFEKWNDEAQDAWGVADGDDNELFFDAPSTKKQTLGKGSTVAFDDGGEPDFAGWLAAQSQAKSKTKTKDPLLKGLSKSGTSKLASRPQPERSASTSALRKTHQITKPPAIPTISKQKEPDPTEDDWGDSWE